MGGVTRGERERESKRERERMPIMAGASLVQAGPVMGLDPDQ